MTPGSGKKALTEAMVTMLAPGRPVMWGIAARMVHRYDCGDHTLFVGEVMAIGLDQETSPLLFHAGKYATLASPREITPGAGPDNLPFFY